MIVALAIVSERLQVSFKAGEAAAFEYIRGLTRQKVEAMLKEAQLVGLVDVIMTGVELLAGQAAASGTALNDKFQQSGKFTVCPSHRAATSHVHTSTSTSTSTGSLRHQSHLH